MNLNDFEPHRRLTTRTQARTALDDTVSESRRFLRIFDDRGEFYGLDRRPLIAGLVALLKRNSDNRVMLVLHDPSFVGQRCPRLCELIRTFSPRLQVLKTDPNIEGFSRGLVIADDAVVLRRPHFGQSYTFIDYDEKAISAAGTLFEEILGHATPVLPGQATGL
jgi:hypothetical protein